MNASYGILLSKRVSEEQSYDFMFVKETKDGNEPFDKVKKILLDSIVEGILKVESLIKVDNNTGTITEQSIEYQGTQFKLKDNNSYMPICSEEDKSGRIICSIGDGTIYYFHSKGRFLEFFKSKVLCKFEVNWITEFHPIQKTSSSRKVALVNNGEFQLI